MAELQDKKDSEKEDDQSSHSTDVSTDLSLEEHTEENNASYEEKDKPNLENIRSEGISVMYTNADSLLGKRDLLQLQISETRPDIICITEALPKNRRGAHIDITREYSIEGYNMYTGSQEKRGVLIYVTKEIHSSRESDLSEMDYEEHVWCTIQRNRQHPLLIGCIYHSPNSTEENFRNLINIIQKSSEKNDRDMIIVGDFNRPHIDWKTWNGRSNMDTAFLDTLQDGFLHQKVEKPTRRRHGQTPTLDDLILCSREDLVENIKYRDPLGKSDHLCITFSIPQDTTEEQPARMRLNMNKGDFEKLREKLAAAEWSNSNENLEQTWLRFERNYNTAVTESIPTKPSKPARWKKPLWMNQKMSKLLKKKYWAWKRYIFTGSAGDHRKYVEIRNAAKANVYRERKNMEKKIAEEAKDNPKSFWTYIRKQTRSCQGVHPLVKPNGEKTTTDEEKVEIWNEFFASVFTSEDKTNIPRLPDFRFATTLNEATIEKEEVMKELKSLKMDKSPGPDAIHPKVLNMCAGELAEPLTDLFRKSLCEGAVPVGWKQANITPIYKKGEKTLAENYRPVSLTSIVCKVLERLLRTQIMKHLHQNKLLSEHQYGFRPQRSTTTQLLRALDEWTDWIDEGSSFDVMYMDFAKAFDSVPHERLMVKVRAHGIRGKVIDWIEDFLKHRKQRVSVNSAQSSWKEVLSGIPQGSVLGPILFILYINDLPNQLKNRALMYADDTKIYAKVNTRNDRDMMQQDLMTALEWAETWQLRFNQEKCKVLHYGRNNQLYDYYMSNNIKMQVTKEEKDLGVIFTGDLKFTEQVAKTVKKGNQMVGIVKRAFKHMDKEMFMNIYKALIRSHLETGNKIWHPIRKTDSDHLENVQRRATKLVPELRSLPYGERLRSLKLHSLVYRRRRGDMIQMYKFTHDQEDIGTNKLYQYAEGITRGHPLKVAKPRWNTKLRQNSFRNRVVNDWNYLPNEVVCAPSLNSFKSRLDTHWSHLHYKFE